MHIPSLMNIHIYSRYHLETKLQTYGRTTDGRTNGRASKRMDTLTPTLNHNTPPLSCDGV